MIPAGIVLLVLIIGTIIFKAVTSGESEEVTAGIAYIQDLEKGDIDEIKEEKEKLQEKAMALATKVYEQAAKERQGEESKGNAEEDKKEKKEKETDVEEADIEEE